MSANHSTFTGGKRLERGQLIRMLQASLDMKSYRFGRQSALAWLAIFPGDIEVNLMQARLLLAEGKAVQAIPILDRLARLDPEYAEVHRVVAGCTYGMDVVRYENAVTSLVALKESRPAGPAVKEWGMVLRESRHQMDRGNYSEAKSILEAASQQPDSPILARIFHLQALASTTDPETLLKVAEDYRSQNQDCLQFNLVKADALMQLGKEPEAVNLLHRSMSMDAAGQVAIRMWGADHPYRAIWTDALSVQFDVPIPAEVAAQMGWNWMLPSTVDTAETPSIISGQLVQEDAVHSGVVEPISNIKLAPIEIQMKSTGNNGKAKETVVIPDRLFEEVKEVHPAERSNPIEDELEKLAIKLKRPAIGRADVRYPVYVVFSTRGGIDGQYGPQTGQILDVEMHRLVDAIHRRTGWETLVYYPDDEKSTAPFGLKPVKDRDPWRLKLAIADLDKALAKKGLMIGMMVIVGGPDVVPFHDLPNPTDDFDSKISSDNPYATLDSNYFVPEWPIGRLPGGAGPESGLLLEQLRYLVAYHNRRGLQKSAFAQVLKFFQSIARLFAFATEKPNYGYTAAIWRRSSLAVFRPVGSPANVMISPPSVSGAVPVERLLAPQLGYYNLHGLADAGEWYGQRDPAEPFNGPDYPVALSPKELHRNGHAPRVIFSEACYGGLIANKTEEEALSLKFLSLGTLAVVGSTCISYGSITTPLLAADLLGNYFWQQVKSGRSVGAALMVAKVELVREMVKRQGYLDAEDQKTLLSFVLYGDPMVSLDSGIRVSKNLLRFKRQKVCKTIEERPVQKDVFQPVSEKVLEEVRKSVAGCLPGIETAEVRIHEELGAVPLEVKSGKSAKSVSPADARYVVTMSKQIPNAKHVHRHYVRATVENGKVVKLAVSR